MTTKHTPGPWIAHSSGDGFIFIERDFGNGKAHPEWIVASIQSYQKEDVTNARLIAAAPELLAALQTLCASLEWEEKRSGTTYAGYESARAALAKVNP